MNKIDQILLVDRICDDFEAKLKSGDDVNVEQMLDPLRNSDADKELSQSLLVELIALEILYSDDRTATANSLRSRFPNFICEIEDALEQPSLSETFGDAVADSCQRRIFM